ncbi:MAG: hypothetical protein P4K80_09625 [Acidobacteriaceae bacterium]|nr:hypothetical protein [Acidobacteriaceae bacterium]
MKALFRLICFLLVLISAGWAQRPATHRTTLRQDTVIQGYPCAKGYAWFYADGRLERCSVSRETTFGEAKIPVQSIIVLLPEGGPKYAMLNRDTVIAGSTCRGGGLLGPSEGAMTAFYLSGKLKQCWLAGDQIVQGVPCRSGGLFGDALGEGVKFYESGRLNSCKLSQEFASQHRGDRFIQAP